MGWNTAEELYAFGDGIFADNVLYEVNDLGIVKVDERTFYLPAFSKMHLDQRDAYQFERSFSCREHGEVTLYEYVRRMVQVFGDNAKVGFAFVLATLFLDVVKQTSKQPRPAEYIRTQGHRQNRAWHGSDVVLCPA